MGKERIETGKSPNIVVTCTGDLRIRGWSETAILIRGQSYTSEQTEKVYDIRSTSDLSLMVPTSSDITVERAAADLAVKNVEGPFSVDEVSGDASLMNMGSVYVGTVAGDMSVKSLSDSFTGSEVSGDAALRNVHEVKMSAVYGDCAARNVNGSFHVEAIMGDLALRTVNGDVGVAKCHRDLNLRNIGGVITAIEILGDARLRGGLTAGKHRLSARGDIVLLWPPEAPLTIEASAQAIKNRMTLDELKEEENTLSGRIGGGEAVLILDAKGRIILKELSSGKDPWEQTVNGGYTFDLGFDLADLGEQISDEISAHMTAWSQRMEDEFGPKFAEKIERKAQQAAVKAEKAAERAIRRAEKAAGRTRWSMGPRFDSDVFTSKSKGKPESSASKEEQLKILRMVEKGIISPDEANTLLEALEG